MFWKIVGGGMILCFMVLPYISALFPLGSFLDVYHGAFMLVMLAVGGLLLLAP